jgi:predicted metal-dependent HD superfamily phosphohydrolase
MLDAPRFHALWLRLGVRADPATAFAFLQTAYAEPHRHYHTASHIRDFLSRFHDVRELAERPDEVEAAIWFHDAVYDTHASDNEERSAKAAGEWMASPANVVELILATKHDREPATRDGALLVDLDLSILAADTDAFDAYDRAIRLEYAWVPAAAYAAGRSKVLQSFLDRPSIYRLPMFRERWEAAARSNLERAIRRL